MKQLNRCVGLTLALGLAFGALGACGDDGGSGNVGGSYASIATAIESPSGTVDASSAADIGEEFEKAAGANLAGGARQGAPVGQTQSGTIPCDAGGDISFTGSGNESSGTATASYNSCCFVEGCCTDGTADMYYSSEQGADYAYCASYDVSYSCDGIDADLQFNGCFSLDGDIIYVIEVDGETFAVSGNYYEGSGTLEIRGENGTWTCTYEDGSGSCSGEGDESFTF